MQQEILQLETLTTYVQQHCAHSWEKARVARPYKGPKGNDSANIDFFRKGLCSTFIMGLSRTFDVLKQST